MPRLSLERFERSVHSAHPRAMAKIAVGIGIVGLGLMLLTWRAEGFGVSPGPHSNQAIRRFEPKFKRTVVIAQAIFSVGLTLTGGALFFRRPWGRVGLQAMIWLYLAASVIALPPVVYLWFLVLRDQLGGFD